MPPQIKGPGPAPAREQLAEVRPDLLERYDAALPEARAAILGRLLTALDREPLGVDRPTDPGTDPAALAARLWPAATLADEIADSVTNLALALANRPESADLPAPGDPEALGKTEQMLLDGHPLHPCCRTRTGMTVADVLAYAPEHRPVIRLRRLRVPADRWYGTGQPVLYAHPWQAHRILAHHPWITDAGPTRPVRPLMSLRTVAPISGGPHIKTAVDVQMTSAVRTVSPAAVHNGPILSRLLTQLTADLPIEILAETEAGAVITDNGPDRHLAHLVRRAPRLARGERAVPLGVLAAVPAWLAETGDPYTIWEELGSKLFAPLATVLDRGVALEAHGQNTLAVLRDGHVQRILYRDLGGVRVRRSLLKEQGIDLHGDLPTDDETALRTKMAAAAIGTVATQLIGALTTHRGADPDRLWATLAGHLREIPDLLTAPVPVKATTAMRLADDPLHDIWTHQPNPMAVYA
ncbi:IucA/IucC family protein [Actinoplanes sp. NPDC051851]|uniref:IucA/IucC family protein n=1 Tax=Actinoplanes sp. NPDC051851 TaxID=3154753 RepID=UPI003432D2DC